MQEGEGEKLVGGHTRLWKGKLERIFFFLIFFFLSGLQVIRRFFKGCFLQSVGFKLCPHGIWIKQSQSEKFGVGVGRKKDRNKSPKPSPSFYSWLVLSIFQCKHLIIWFSSLGCLVVCNRDFPSPLPRGKTVFSKGVKKNPPASDLGTGRALKLHTSWKKGCGGSTPGYSGASSAERDTRGPTDI